MFDLQEVLDALDALERGKVAMEYLQSKMLEADKADAFYVSMYIRYCYIWEAHYYGYSYEVVMAFPEYLAKFDSIKTKENAKYVVLEVMESYDYFLNACIGFYQAKEIENFFEDYKQRCIYHGYSLRTYYYRRLCSGNPLKKVEELLELFRKNKRDELSYSPEAELNLEIGKELSLGNINKALRLAAPVLNGEIYPDTRKEVCEMLMRYYNKTGRYKEAEQYIEDAYYWATENRYVIFDTIGEIIEIYSFINTKKGLAIWRKHMKQVLEDKTPLYILWIYIGSYRLFNAMSEAGEKSVYFTDFPEKFSLYNKNSRYKTAKLAEYFKKEAQRIGDEFDTRIGGDDNEEDDDEEFCFEGIDGFFNTYLNKKHLYAEFYAKRERIEKE